MMARSVSRLSFNNILLLLCFIGFCKAHLVPFPEFDSVSLISNSVSVVNDVEIRKIVFGVQGKNLQKKMQIKVTEKNAPRNTECKETDLTNFEIHVIKENVNETQYELQLPRTFNQTVYFCLPREPSERGLQQSVTGNQLAWFHQGESVAIKLDSANFSSNGSSIQVDDTRSRRGQLDSRSGYRIFGLRFENGEKEPFFNEDGVPELLAGRKFTLRLFGYGLIEELLVVFTQEAGQYGGTCLFPITKPFPIIRESVLDHTAQVQITLPMLDGPLYLCATEGIRIGDEVIFNGTRPFVHQGSELWIRVSAWEKLLPLWVQVLIIVTCLCFSCLFSGLNLGLMAMDQTELKILVNTGNPTERKYARAIAPVRAKGNFLLCSILLGNVLVNSIFTILLDDLTSGLIAVIFSTLCIVIFGEICPQAVCSRHGLAVGAKTIHITKIVMVLTFPLSYPISRTLDCVLGEEIGNVYTRERLKELVKLQVTTGKNDLDRDEVNIISGALELRKKTVADVMTKIEDVFMLDYEAVLDFETVSEIMKSGFSRVPVYEGSRNNIVTMLYIKDLAFVDPDDNTPLKTLCQFYQNPCNFVFEDTTLDVMFKIFKEGNKGHMAFVQRVNNEGEGDPFYETVGLITLEDVIEELIQAEIMDETDVFTDNRSKRRRNADRSKQDFSVFAEKKGESNKVRISPQLTLAAFQYLSTSVGPFKSDSISETILLRLLKQDIYHNVKKSKDWRNDPLTLIYQQGKPVDYFVLILEGRVEVTVGRENLVFESGPFTFFGTQALMQNVGIAESPSSGPTGSLQSLNMDALIKATFQPDYSVRACTEVLYMKVRRSLYLAAKRATLMERSQKDSTASGDQFDDEVEKLLHAFEDDISTGRRSPDVHQIQSHRSSIGTSKTGTPKMLSPQSGSKLVSSSNQLSPPRGMNGPFKKLTEDEVSGSTGQNSIGNAANKEDKEEEKVSLLTTV
ncbi:metal transporter CNNM4 [Agrilus planipennis]|uniref:Metal transporter CNNM4 n=1 Tax=Agrilus planipennis TaxID=224129 RepID=A0A1W4XF17_AGRPL|nr:metal transporter CNNM4 [Agrilus planipennis]